jgi:hypothetical protein
MRVTLAELGFALLSDDLITGDDHALPPGRNLGAREPCRTEKLDFWYQQLGKLSWRLEPSASSPRLDLRVKPDYGNRDERDEGQ